MRKTDQRSPRLWMTACLGLAATLLTAAPSPAQLPGQVSFQGLLVDSSGQPISGSVDLEFRLYAFESGGSALWSESHDAVDVLDGVYDVALGSVSPLTAIVQANPSLYLEIDVDGETLTPRQRLLAVPFAIRAESADSVDGVDAVFVSQLFTHVDYDGGDPPNDDPTEGFDDVDADGRANFIDNDNDGDGLLDAAELAQGTDINLSTPVITGFAPASADADEITSVQVQGQNFEPGLAVVFGSQTPTASNVAATSFDVQVGPQAPGSAAVTVTLANGESDTGSFDFFVTLPTITGFSPEYLDANQVATVEIQGTNFEPGMTVSFGSQSPTPTNVTPTSLDVVVGPQPAGSVSVEVTRQSGRSATASFDFAGRHRLVFVTSTGSSGNLGGLAGADATCQSLASSAGLGSAYSAWLADDAQSPATRFAQDGSFFLTSGELVAADWSDLTDGMLDYAINRTETGGLAAAAVVWSNVATDGSAKSSTDHCDNWTAASGTVGWAGDSDAVDSGWTEFTTFFCQQSGRIYCVED